MVIARLVRLPVTLPILGGLIALLILDIMGIRPFVLSAILYLVSFLVGHEVNRRFGCVRSQDQSFFEFLGIVAFETVVGIGFLALLLFLSRALGISDWVVLGPALAIGVAVAGWRLRSSGPELISGRKEWRSSALVSVFVVILFLTTFAISDSFVSNGSNLYFRDTKHPLYESSIGKSTTRPGLIKPDLSYNGKTVQFHMLGPEWVSVLQDTLGIDDLVAVYRVLPVWQLLLSLPMMALLARRISRDDFIAVMTPALALFLTTFAVLPTAIHLPGGLNSLWVLDALVVQPSTAVGMSALLAFMVLCISAPHDRLNGGLALMGMVLAAFVFFSKATLAIPLLAALGILAARNLILRHKWSGVIFTVLCGIAVLPFALLMLGAHAQNFWAFVPHIQYFTWLVQRLHAEDSLLLQLVSWGVALPLGTLGVFGLLPIGVYLGWRTRMPDRIVQAEDTEHSYLPQLIFGSAGLALLMSGLISEFTEWNHLQFSLGYLWIGWLGILMWYRRQRWPRWLSMPVYAIVIGVLLFNLAVVPLRPVVPLYSDDQHLTSPLVVKAKVAILHSIPRILGMEPGLARREQGREQGFFVYYLDKYIYVPRMGFSMDLYGVLEKMQDMPGSAMVMRGRQYEDLAWQARTTATSWFPTTTFFASGISGRQFVIEDFKYKGIAVQEDYMQRSGDVFRFYWWCTERDQSNPNSDGWNLPPGPEPPSDSEEGIDLTLVRALTIKGNPSWLTARRAHYDMLVKLSRELAQDTYSLTERIELCRTVLDRYGVTDVMFERGERPDPAIAAALGLTQSIAEGSVSVFHYQ